MAKRKRSKKRPQPKHKKQKKSQHDKRKRLERPNPKRKKTTNTKVPLTGAMQTAVSVLQAVMDRRIAFRLAIIIAGMLLADDRRTASAWFAAAGDGLTTISRDMGYEDLRLAADVVCARDSSTSQPNTGKPTVKRLFACQQPGYLNDAKPDFRSRA